MTPKKKKVRNYGLDENGMMGIYAISLVDFPAIEVDFVALSKKNNVKMTEVNKEKRLLYGPVLIPDQLIYRVDPETQEEYYAKYSAEVIEQTMQLYFKKNQHHNATLMHEVPVQGLTVVEHWIKMGQSDKSVELGFDLPVGTAFVGMKVDDDEIWQHVKEGTFKGFSIEAWFMQVGENLSSHVISELESDLMALSNELERLSR